MTQTVLIVGSNGGIGSSCFKEFEFRGYQVIGLTRKDLDLNHPEAVFEKNFQNYDILLNCSGHSQGTYLGFLKNSWDSQVSQIQVNYMANLALLKHYATTRSQGQYVWISSSVVYETPRPFHSIYASTKQASKTAIDLIRQEAQHISILEVAVGLVRTGFRYGNFNGTRTHQEVNSMYDQENSLTPEYVASRIADAVQQKLQLIHIQ